MSIGYYGLSDIYGNIAVSWPLNGHGIPSVLFLMGFGILLGPVFHVAEPTAVMKLVPYFRTLALLIILFDGGINIHIMKVVSETPMALLYSVMVFGMTILTIMGFYVWITHASWLHGLLLSTIWGAPRPPSLSL